MSHFKCCVPHCEVPAYHGFPMDSNLALEWQVAINRREASGELWSPKEDSQICYRHFNAQDFIDPKRLSRSSAPLLRLRPGSVPSKNLATNSKNGINDGTKINVTVSASKSSTNGAKKRVFTKRKPKSKTANSNDPVCKPSKATEVGQMWSIELEKETEAKSMNWNTGNHYPNPASKIEPVDANKDMKNVVYDRSESSLEGPKIINVRSMAPSSNPSYLASTINYYPVEEQQSVKNLSNQTEGNKYDCKRCLKNFTTPDHFLKHALIVPRHLLHCKYCSLTFKSICNREIHEYNHALAERYCLQCEIPFPRAKELKNHFKSCPNATLFIEPKLYAIMEKIERRHNSKLNRKKMVKYFVNKSKSTLSFDCPLCSFSTSLKEVLIGHLQECKSLHVKGDIERVCCECRYTTKDKLKFGRHFLHRLSNRECQLESRDDSEESDSNDEPIFLDWSSSGELQMTQNPGCSIVSEPETSILPPKPTAVIKSSIRLVGPMVYPSVFQCSKCGKNYSSRMNLQKHMTIDCIAQKKGAGLAPGI